MAYHYWTSHTNNFDIMPQQTLIKPYVKKKIKKKSHLHGLRIPAFRFF